MVDPLALLLARLELDERLATEALRRTAGLECPIAFFAALDGMAAESRFHTGGLVPLDAPTIRLPDCCAGLRAPR